MRCAHGVHGIRRIEAWLLGPYWLEAYVRASQNPCRPSRSRSRAQAACLQLEASGCYWSRAAKSADGWTDSVGVQEGPRSFASGQTSDTPCCRSWRKLANGRSGSAWHGLASQDLMHHPSGANLRAPRAALACALVAICAAPIGRPPFAAARSPGAASGHTQTCSQPQTCLARFRSPCVESPHLLAGLGGSMHQLHRLAERPADHVCPRWRTRRNLCPFSRPVPASGRGVRAQWHTARRVSSEKW